MHAKRSVGLHFKVENSYYDIAKLALDLGVNSMQFLPVSSITQKHLPPLKEDLKNFLSLRHKFQSLYIHSSFKINLATKSYSSHKISTHFLKKEIEIAKELEANYIVLHIGYANGYERNDKVNIKSKGITKFVKSINKLLKDQNSIKILLENTPHGNYSIGSNLEDFIVIKNLMEYPDQVGFCLDTAHAHVYGYDLSDTSRFISLINQTMGIENIKLIHLNDSREKCASKIDFHELPGSGKIGMNSLMSIANHNQLSSVPLIVESSSNCTIEKKAEWVKNNIKLLEATNSSDLQSHRSLSLT